MVSIDLLKIVDSSYLLSQMEKIIILLHVIFKNYIMNILDKVIEANKVCFYIHYNEVKQKYCFIV